MSDNTNQQPEHPLSQYNEYCISLNAEFDTLPSYQDWLEAEVMRLQAVRSHAVSHDVHNDAVLEMLVTLANEIERLQAIESRAVTINNALLTAVQSMMQFMTPQVQERMQAALQPVIDLLEKKP